MHLYVYTIYKLHNQKGSFIQIELVNNNCCIVQLMKFTKIQYTYGNKGHVKAVALLMLSFCHWCDTVTGIVHVVIHDIAGKLRR